VGEVIAQEAGLTPIFAGSKVTVAVICEVPLRQEGGAGQACTVRGFAESETLMAAKIIVMVPFCVGSLTEVAVMVTDTSMAGGVIGAV
jgi:hypothetical protein